MRKYKIYSLLENHPEISELSIDTSVIPPSHIRKEHLDKPLNEKLVWNPNKAGEVIRIEYYENFVDGEDSQSGDDEYSNLIMAEDFEYTYRQDGKHKNRKKYICYAYTENGNEYITSGNERYQCATKNYYGIKRNKADVRRRDNSLYHLQIDIVSFLTAMEPDFETDFQNALANGTQKGIALWGTLKEEIEMYRDVGSTALYDIFNDMGHQVYTDFTWLNINLSVLNPELDLTFSEYIRNNISN